MNDRNKKTVLLAVILISLLKIFFISNEEIASLYLPHDDLWQITAANNYVWGDSYHGLSLLHLPIFPLVVKLISFTGIPFRLFYEVLYCLSICYLSYASFEILKNKYIVLVAGVLAIFNPSSFELPNRIAPEIFLAPLLTLSISATLHWWTQRRTPNAYKISVIASILWALTWNTRKESIVLFISLIAFGLFLFVFSLYKEKTFLYSNILYGVLAPVLLSMVLSNIICSINYLRWGLYTTTIITSPGYNKLYNLLESIPQDHPRRYIPVPIESLQRAYKISPSFEKLQPFLGGDLGEAWGRVSKVFTDTVGMSNLDKRELAGGWFFLALHDSAVAAGEGGSPKREDDFFKKCSNEIITAQKNSLIGHRIVPVSMVDANLDLWMKELPSSFKKIIATFYQPTIGTLPLFDDGSGAVVSSLYDKLANRRSYSTSAGNITIGGWVSARENDIKININENETLLATASPTAFRPDINKNKNTGFYLKIPYISESRRDLGNYSLKILSGQNTVKEINLNKLNSSCIYSGESNPEDKVGIEVFNVWIPNKYIVKKIEKWYESLYMVIFKFISFMCIISVPISLYNILKHNQSFEFLGAIILLAAVVISRILLFTILDASSFNGDQPRYIFSIIPAFIFLINYTIYAAFLSFKKLE